MIGLSIESRTTKPLQLPGDLGISQAIWLTGENPQDIVTLRHVSSTHPDW
jgi:hypothetical protein